MQYNGLTDLTDFNAQKSLNSLTRFFGSPYKPVAVLKINDLYYAWHHFVKHFRKSDTIAKKVIASRNKFFAKVILSLKKR